MFLAQFGASAVVMSYAVSAPCGELTAPCRSEPERLAIQKHLPGDGWEGAECVQRRPENGRGAAGLTRVGSLCARASLCRGGFVQSWERIGRRLVKVSSAKISLQGK